MYTEPAGGIYTGCVAHTYHVSVSWTGNTGTGTSGYRDYRRDHAIDADGRPTIAGSSDPAFRGDPSRWNPEQLLVVSLSQCHMLWYLHLCAEAGVVVTDYRDDAVGEMVMNSDGSGQFRSVTLRPQVRVASGDSIQTARELHASVPELCFIARSVNFAVHHEPTVTT